MSSERLPPLGVRLTVDVETVQRAKGPVYKARVRWTHPVTHHREGTKRVFDTGAEVDDWLRRMQTTADTGVDPGQTLGDYVAFIGDRWTRGIDPTSTYDPYSAGLRLRVLPTLGHLPVGLITAGLVDRAIDRWEQDHSRSTVKNSVAVFVLVLDEAVRDGIIVRNPAKDRARRKTVGRSLTGAEKEPANPRDLALPDVATLDQLVAKVVEAGGHQSWGDMVTILATTALRISEVSGLLVGDIDLDRGLIHVFRQTYPGRGGLVTKETKGRRRRTVPIIDPLRPTLERLTQGCGGDLRLLSGPRGGVITTATLRDATCWDDQVRAIGQPGLVRHGLRHTALTWMADLLTPFAAKLTNLVPEPLQRLRAIVDKRIPTSHENSLDGSRENIGTHYDLSNALFEAFLDPTMSYSAAWFDESGSAAAATRLEEAQLRKIDGVLDYAGVRPGTRLLEIGTGWGALAIRAAQRGAHVTTVTISAEQLAFATDKVEEAGLSDQVELRLQDYREVDGQFDAIVSVEMVEAVGEVYWPTYFATIDRLLAPGGKVSIQAITMAHERVLATRRSFSWIQKYIFPGGIIPSLQSIDETLAAHTTLRVTERRELGVHYARTLHLWRERFNEQWPRIHQLGFDETFRRMWEFYLAYCEAGFRSRYLGVSQLQMTREPAWS